MHSFVLFCFFYFNHIPSFLLVHSLCTWCLKTGDGGDDNGDVNDCDDGDRSGGDEEGMGAILMRQDLLAIVPPLTTSTLLLHLVLAIVSPLTTSTSYSPSSYT